MLRVGISVLWACAVIVYFYFKAPVSMQADWTHDDLMNCYRALETPWATCLTDIVMFWRQSTLFRPVGELLYKIGFDLTGFDMRPWRLFISAILVFNSFLVAFVGMRLSGSLGYGLAAAAIAAFHPNWFQLYTNSGTIFEVLAFTFVYLGLGVYIEFHRKPWVIWISAAVYIFALNCKESAIVFPILIVFYDLLWHKRINWKLCALLGIISFAFVYGRVLDPKGISSIGMYRPAYTVSSYIARFQSYFASLILWKEVPIWAAFMLAMSPLIVGKRVGVFASLIFPIGILPLAFVPERGLDGVYIACAGLALGLACLLLYLPTEKLRVAGALVIFVVVGQWLPARKTLDGMEKEYADIRGFHQQLKALAPIIPSNVQVSFLNEPFPPVMLWASVFTTRLLYRDTTIEVIGCYSPERPKYNPNNDFAQFDWRDGKLIRLK